MLSTIRFIEDRRPRSNRRAGLKSLLSLLAIAASATGASACGSTPAHTASSTSAGAVPTSSATTTSVTATTDYTRVDGDRDNDIGAPYDDKNNNTALEFGHEASRADRRAITALIERYYTVTLASDGAKACSMLISTLAEAVPEDYGQPPGPPYMRGAKTCQTAVTLLFKHIHAQVAKEAPKLRVTHIYLDEHRGIALLSFGALPERKISVAREAGIWKITTLTDDELP